MGGNEGETRFLVLSLSLLYGTDGENVQTQEQELLPSQAADPPLLPVLPQPLGDQSVSARRGHAS